MAEHLPYNENAVLKTGEKIVARTRGLTELSIENLEGIKPILVLIHGYPQTSHIFRELVPLLPKDLPLYIPDIPGYGESTATEKTSFTKQNLGVLILEALLQHLPKDPRPYPVVLIGHDRGARIIQSLSHHNPLAGQIDIKGAALLDIVPVPEQFNGFSNPRQVASTFHWAFLAAKYPLPEEMIGAYGGANFARGCIERWSGTNKERVAVLLKNFEEYAATFGRPETIHATCEDYRAGATEDYDELQKAKEEGNKIKHEVLFAYSDKYLSEKYGVPWVYKDYVEEGKLTTALIKDTGHFLVEEQPEATAEAINSWLKQIGIEFN